jgi:tetratricopeptide (TPR) repeat protein
MASKIEKMVAEMRRAQDLVQEDKAEEALGVYRGLLAEARKMGHEPGYLHYAIAVALDDAGDLEKAFEEITMAIGKDPLCLPFRRSFEVIVGRIRSALADPKRAVDDASTPRLYALLVRGDAADVASHAAMARHLLATGKGGEARALADALTRLHPASLEVWELAGAVAHALGDAAGAERARIEAAALAHRDAPFATVGVASA